jgi:hypothetical protein
MMAAIGGVPPASLAGAWTKLIVSNAWSKRAIFATALTPVSGSPEVRLDAPRLDLDKEVSCVGDGDPHPPAAVRAGPARRLAHDGVVGVEPALVEQEDRAVRAVLLLVGRVDAFERPLERDPGFPDRSRGKQGASEVAAGVRSAAGVEAVAVTGRTEGVAARHRPGGPIACRISIEVIVQDERRRVFGRARENADDVGPALALRHEVDRKAHVPQLARDDERGTFLPGRRLVRIKGVLGVGLAGRNELAREVEPSLFRDAVENASLDVSKPLVFHQLVQHRRNRPVDDLGWQGACHRDSGSGIAG